MILHSLFSDHMVIQRDKPIYLRGMGAGQVTATFMGKTYKHFSKGGDWMIELPAQTAGGPYEMTVDLDGEVRTITDIMIGEVFIAGGQSNMQMGLGESVPPRDGIEDCPLVRYYHTRRPEIAPRQLGEYWSIATKEKAPAMSAVAWVAATKFAKEKNIAVGIVTAFQGAAILQSYIRRDLLMAHPAGHVFTPRYGEYMMAHTIWSPRGMLYDLQIRHLSPLSVRAVLWYQGESNAHPVEAKMFTDLMRLLLQCFREAFCDPELPFIQVQLAPHGRRGYNTTIGREMQWKASKEIPGLAIVTIGDVGDYDNIHPLRKEQVGDRVYRAIRHTVFGETDIPYLGPVKKACVYDGNTVTVTFDHIEGGLTTDGEIDNCYLLDEAGERHLATCRIVGETLVATANIPRAVGIEFGMEPFNEMHLFNGETLPAVEFEDHV